MPRLYPLCKYMDSPTPIQNRRPCQVEAEAQLKEASCIRIKFAFLDDPPLITLISINIL